MSMRIRCLGTKDRFLAPIDADVYQVPLGRILDIQPADQTVTVEAGVPIAELQAALAEHGQCLPIPDPAEFGSLAAGFPGSVGGALAMDLPHALVAQCRGPRDWLLQIEVLFRGQPAVSGAKVVKSVAGYDVHKVFVGSRGTLGPILSATLRTCPVASVPKPASVIVRADVPDDVWILRTLPSLFEKAINRAQGLLVYDPASSTLWCDTEPMHPEEGWVIGPRGEVWQSTGSHPLEKRLKSVFDPEDEWN